MGKRSDAVTVSRLGTPYNIDIHGMISETLLSPTLLHLTMYDGVDVTTHNNRHTHRNTLEGENIHAADFKEKKTDQEIKNQSY